MTSVGRFSVRIFSYSVYVILVAACIAFVLSEVPEVRWAGILLVLFLLDAAKHVRHADKTFDHRINHKVNVAEYLSPNSYTILEYAFERALFTKGNFYLFLISRLIDRKEIRGGLFRMDVVPEEFEHKVDEYLKTNLQRTVIPVSRKEYLDFIRNAVEKISRLAFQNAMATGSHFIEPKDLFGGLGLVDDDAIQQLLQLFDIRPSDLEHALIFSRFYIPFWQTWRIPSTIGGFVQKPHTIRHRIMNRSWSARPTPTLDKYSEDLTDYAREEKIGFLIGHTQEYEWLVDILGRPMKPNALLVGEPGVGKETLVAHLAYQITKDKVPAPLFDKRIVMLNISSMAAGAEPGELQARIKKIIEEITKAGNIILYIPEIHNVLKTSGTAYLSVADALLPAIASTAFSVIGTTYPREFKQTIGLRTDFANAFETIQIEEITEEEAIKILVYQSIILERQYKIVISYGAVKQSVLLAKKYFRNRLLPSSAAELLKEALSNVSAREEKILRADDVIDIAQRKVNIPLRQAKEAEAEKLLNLETLIHERFIDQEQAVKAVAQALREYRSGLSRKGGPIATFLFVGPTGVGKTELSKLLSKIQFGSSEAMTRFDMSEYQDKQSIFRFIGSPDGSASGQLTEEILKKPYGLILLDEFEKAHPDILNLFLQVFDDGRLTDNLGRVADFQNTIIIATSNAHSDFIKSEIERGQSMEAIFEELKKKLTQYFKPELLNRFSGIVAFKSLSPEDIEAIAKIQLMEMSVNLQETHKITLEFAPEAIRQIAQWGYDPVFGARPLRGVISDKIRSVLAEKILKNEIGRGTLIRVVLENNTLVFQSYAN